MKKLWVIFFLYSQTAVLAQPSLDVKSFRKLTTTDQRLDFLKGSNVTQMSKETFEGLLPIIVQEKKDGKVQFYWYYQKVKYGEHLKYGNEELAQTLETMYQFAKDQGYKPEMVISEFRYALFKFGQKKITEQEVYLIYLNCFERIKKIGFPAFKRYNLEWTLNEISRNFYELGAVDKAFEILLVVEKNTTPRPNDMFYTLSLNLIQTIYAERKDYENAIKYAQKIYDINFSFNTTQNPDRWETFYWQGLASLDMARYMLEMGNIKDCEMYADRGYELSKAKIDLTLPAISMAEFEALQVYIWIKLRLGKINEVEPLFKRSEAIKPHLGLRLESYYFKPLPLYKNYVTYYEVKKDYTNAYRYIKLANELQDSLDRRNDQRNLWQQALRVTTDLQIKSAEEATKFQQRLRNLAVLSLFLFAAFAFIVYRRIKKDNQTIAEQKNLLEQSLGEKENLLKEIHHRVKNNLQIISGLFDKQSRQTTDELTKKLMKEGQDRVFSIALVHQNLYQSENLTSIEIKSYLEMLSKNIEKSQKGEHQNIQLTLDVDDSVVDIDTAIPLGLILNELITNCYKYAFKDREKGEIQVRFRQKAKELILGVKDNGVGLPSDFDIQKTRSLGLNLVRGLVRQLNGKMDFKSSTEGTTFSIYCIN